MRAGLPHKPEDMELVEPAAARLAAPGEVEPAAQALEARWLPETAQHQREVR